MCVTKSTFLSLVSAGGTPCKSQYSAEPRCTQKANMLVCNTESHAALLLGFVRLQNFLFNLLSPCTKHPEVQRNNGYEEGIKFTL